MEGHDDGVIGAAVCRQGRTAVTSGDDGMVLTWDLGSAKSIHSMAPGNMQSQVWLDGAGTTAASADGNSMSFWDVTRGKLLSRHIWDGTINALHNIVQGMYCNQDLSVVAAVVSQGQGSAAASHAWAWRNG